ncbi:MAG: hypothetical protein JHD02_08025 [Thermoleophilaceae bacterium]|nr:hypothetical protein [Thermoleophilaceae bacterium]
MAQATLTHRTPVVLLKVIAVLGTILVVVPIALVLFGLVVQQFHAPVTAESLNVSVGVAAGSAFVGDGFGECERRSDRTWQCEVSDQSGSGSYVYLVTTESDSSCWTALLGDDLGESPPRRSLSSCVGRFEEGWWGVLGV